MASAIATTQPRGIRNNNPGNIEYDRRVPWIGQLGIELLPAGEHARFARFDTPEHGIRAMAKILIAYQVWHKLRCLLDMCRRWAPAEDGNDPQAYADRVVASVNADRISAAAIDCVTPIDLHDPLMLAAVVRGFIKEECGNFEYPAAVLAAGVQLAEPGSV